MPKGSRALAQPQCNIAIAGFSHGEKDNARKWIGNMGGKTVSSIDRNTTHVIASKSAWKSGHKIIDQAAKENETRNFRAEINIVTMSWIEDSSVARTKKAEGPYLWEKMPRDSTHNGQESSGFGGEKVVKKPSTQKMMKDVLLESTEMHADEEFNRATEKEIKALEKRKKLEERVRKEEEKAAKAQMDEAEVFMKGAKKARNDIFTENHHIYADSTGFKYDVTLTRVDTRTNRNERYHLTLYESNAEPHTYAVNLQFGGTGHTPNNNLLSALGSNFATTFRHFKDAFKQKTGGVKWDDRVEHALKRVASERRDRGQGTGSDTASKPGLPVQSEAVAKTGSGNGKKVVEFKDMPFEYHPPRFGPKGLLPKEKVAAAVEKYRGERVEAWMSGANGDGAEEGGGEHGQVGTVEAAEIPNETIDAVDVSAEAHVDVAGPTVEKDYCPGSTFDLQATEMFEETYPFDDPALMADTDFDKLFSDIPNDVTTAAETSGAALPDFSFDTEGAASAEATQGPSFDLPPSTVLESGSFRPGEQEVGETQIAERAAGEFEEFMEQEVLSQVQNEGGAEKTKGLDLGASILGKRKAADTVDEHADAEAVKKFKLEAAKDEDAYLLDSQLNGHDEEEEVPRVVAEEEQLEEGEEGAEELGGEMTATAEVEEVV